MGLEQEETATYGLHKSLNSLRPSSLLYVGLKNRNIFQKMFPLCYHFQMLTDSAYHKPFIIESNTISTKLWDRLYEFTHAAVTQVGWLNQQRFLMDLRLIYQDQDEVCFQGLSGWLTVFVSFPLFLHYSPSPVFSRHWFIFHPYEFPPFHKDTHFIALGHILKISFWCPL